MTDTLELELALLVFLIILTRIFYVIHKITTGHTKTATHQRKSPAETVICIGSGGHTTEMLALLQTLDFTKYSPRHYVIANTDTTSYSKVNEIETIKAQGDYFIKQIPRSRVVNQSYFTSMFTTLYSIMYSIPLIVKIRPDLILCNGPGTCIPICLIAFALNVAFICNTRIVFIESFCRTRTFSLTGKILMYVADNVLVQWPFLKRKLKRSDYIGQLL